MVLCCKIKKATFAAARSFPNEKRCRPDTHYVHRRCVDRNWNFSSYGERQKLPCSRIVLAIYLGQEICYKNVYVGFRIRFLHRLLRFLIIFIYMSTHLHFAKNLDRKYLHSVGIFFLPDFINIILA